MTKGAAHYVDRGAGSRCCLTCGMFHDAGWCDLVAGRISPRGWCRHWIEKK